MYITNEMGLTVWNLLADLFDHSQLAGNWTAINIHNHTNGQGVQIPTGGIANGAITNAKLASGAVTWDKFANDSSTTLPVSPYDGQISHLVVDATNGVVWTFRYRAGSGSAYKWEFVGGPPLSAEVVTFESLAGSTNIYKALTTPGPTITIPTLPSGGDFDVAIGASIYNTVGTGPLLAAMSYNINGTGAGNPAAEARFQSGQTPLNETFEASVVARRRHTALTSGTVLLAQYWADGGGGATANFANRTLTVLPVRVG